MKQIKQPPRELLSSVFDILDEHQVKLNEVDVEITVAVVLNYLEAYPKGNEFLAKLLKLNTVKARHDKRYILRDKFSALTKEVKPESIIFLQGCVSEGEAVPLDSLMVIDKPKETCGSCGASVICSKQYAGDSLCSNCLSRQEDMSARDLVELSCENCSYEKCSWHPSRAADNYPQFLEKHYG